MELAVLVLVAVTVAMQPKACSWLANWHYSTMTTLLHALDG